MNSPSISLTADEVKLLQEAPPVLSTTTNPKELQALKDFLERPAPEFKTVTVQCNRKRMLWEVTFENGVVEFLSEGVLVDVSLSVKNSMGCGDAPTGFATGKLSSRTVTSIPGDWKSLRFSPNCGCFHCQDKAFEKVDYLVLLPGCSNRFFIP